MIFHLRLFFFEKILIFPRFFWIIFVSVTNNSITGQSQIDEPISRKACLATRGKE